MSQVKSLTSDLTGKGITSTLSGGKQGLDVNINSGGGGIVPNPLPVTADIIKVGGVAINLSGGEVASGTQRIVQGLAKVITITQVTVPATANGILLIAANANRIKVRITNTGTTPVYVYKDNTVTVSNGDYLAGIAGYPYISRYSGTLYGIVASGTQVVTVYEESTT